MLKSTIIGAVALAGVMAGVMAAPAYAGHHEKGEAAPSIDLTGAPSGAYVADQGHRYITFTYDHQGYSAPFLRWRDWTAALDWNAEDPTASSLSVSIDATSIDSGVDAFDDHLKAEDFFNVAEYPTITFTSTKLDRTGPNTGKITGDLTIKDVTKPVTLDATINKADFNQFGKKHKIGFSAKTSILRSDFGVGKYAPVVGDKVDLIIEVEFDEAAASE